MRNPHGEESLHEQSFEGSKTIPSENPLPATTQPKIQSRIDFNPFKFDPELVESLRQQQDFFDIPLVPANPKSPPVPKSPRPWRFRFRPVSMN